MAMLLSPNASPTEVTFLPWEIDRPPQKGPEYYKNLEKQFSSFLNGNEILAVPYLMEMANTPTISLLTMDLKMCKLIAVNRDVIEEVLKILQISAKILARQSNAMWDILLATEDAAKSLAGCVLTTKIVRLQTGYLGTRKSKVTLHRIPLFISEDHLGFSFSQFGEVLPIRSKAGIATGDVEILITLNRKQFMKISNTLMCEGKPIYVKDINHSVGLVVPWVIFPRLAGKKSRTTATTPKH